MMTCEEMIEWYGDFADGRVPFTTSMSMRMHLMMCKHCARYYTQARQIAVLTSQYREVIALNEDEEPLLLGEARDAVFAAFRDRGAS